MPKEKLKTYALHLGLFIITLFTTTLVGYETTNGIPLFLFIEVIELDEKLKAIGITETGQQFLVDPKFSLMRLLHAMKFSLSFLFILSVHEFGHYFMAQYHKVKATLPYYIPFYIPFIGMLNPIGTFGAVIRIKDVILSRKHYFDIGYAGPLAGFIAALGILFYGFTHLPDPEHIFTIHPEYQEYGLDYASHVYEGLKGEGMLLSLGTNGVFEFFKSFVASDPALVPNPYEIIHYPFLYAGFLALFFTALNLLPIGQLDGGHILYGLIGAKKHRVVATTIFIAFIYYAGLGFVSPYDNLETEWKWVIFYFAYLYIVFSRVFDTQREVALAALTMFAAQYFTIYFFPEAKGYQLWMTFGFLLGRVIGVQHPPTLIEEKLDSKRQVIGWVSLLIFLLCFSPQPFIFE